MSSTRQNTSINKREIFLNWFPEPETENSDAIQTFKETFQYRSMVNWLEFCINWDLLYLRVCFTYFFFIWNHCIWKSPDSTTLDLLTPKDNSLFNSNFMMPLIKWNKPDLKSVECWLWMGCTSAIKKPMWQMRRHFFCAAPESICVPFSNL